MNTHEPDRRTIAELGEDFVQANDKPPERRIDWLRIECICVEVGAWALLGGFVAFFLYCLHELK